MLKVPLLNAFFRLSSLSLSSALLLTLKAEIFLSASDDSNDDAQTVAKSSLKSMAFRHLDVTFLILQSYFSSVLFIISFQVSTQNHQV